MSGRKKAVAQPRKQSKENYLQRRGRANGICSPRVDALERRYPIRRGWVGFEVGQRCRFWERRQWRITNERTNLSGGFKPENEILSPRLSLNSVMLNLTSTPSSSVSMTLFVFCLQGCQCTSCSANSIPGWQVFKSSFGNEIHIHNAFQIKFWK